jgi:hypothetical protein
VLELDNESVDATLERDMENREARPDQKDCIPAPQFPNAAFASDAACATLTGRIGVPNTESLDVCLLISEVGLLPSEAGIEDSPASDFETFTEVSYTLLARSELNEIELVVRCCCHRSRTPSTALKKFDELAVIVREMASRVGASCCSSFSS